MSTRSNIALVNDDGSVTAIYCHSDGYPEGVGLILKRFYNTREKVQKLIDLGDISSLAPSVEKPAGHTFNAPIKGYTVTYHRDRGENYYPPLLFPDIDAYYEYLQSPQNHMYEYAYVFIDTGAWRPHRLEIINYDKNKARVIQLAPATKL